MLVDEIISGGQTGPDRAALDAAIESGIPHGGWCPKGRLAEDGIIANKYHLKETPTSEYSQRTIWNIRDSDGTLILVPKTPVDVKDGTILTISEVQKQKKPYMIIDMSQKPDINEISDWIISYGIKKLNVAGPRESQSPGIYAASFTYLKEIFSHFLNKKCSVQSKL